MRDRSTYVYRLWECDGTDLIILFLGVCLCGVLKLSEHGGGRGRPFGRENGIHPSSRGSSAVPNSNSAHSQAKPSVSSST